MGKYYRVCLLALAFSLFAFLSNASASISVPTPTIIPHPAKNWTGVIYAVLHEQKYDNGDLKSNSYKLYAISASPKTARLIQQAQGTDAYLRVHAVSPDGRYLLYTMNTGVIGGLYWHDLQTRKTSALPIEDSFSQDQPAHISPDNSFILLVNAKFNHLKLKRSETSNGHLLPLAENGNRAVFVGWGPKPAQMLLLIQPIDFKNSDQKDKIVIVDYEGILQRVVFESPIASQRILSASYHLGDLAVILSDNQSGQANDDRSGSVLLIKVDTGKTKVFSLEKSDTITFLPKDQYAIIGSSETDNFFTFHAIRLADKKTANLSYPTDNSIRWSPDGQYVAFGQQLEAYHIGIFNLNECVERGTCDIPQNCFSRAWCDTYTDVLWAQNLEQAQDSVEFTSFVWGTQ